MNEKSLSPDLLEKGANLCRFLENEKDEHLLSEKLFLAISALCECCYSLNNPTLSKADIALLRKNATLEADKTALYLNALQSGGYISPAQKESMAKTLDMLKKETNI